MHYKRILAGVLCAGLLFSFAACGKDNNPDSGKESTTVVDVASDVKPYSLGKKEIVDEKYEGEVLLARVSYETLYPLNPNSPLRKALEEFNDSKKNGDLAKDELWDMVETDYAESPEGFNGGLFYLEESTVRIRRADESFVSIVEEHYSYYGGVHPNSAFTANTWNTKTGKAVTLADLVKDPEKLPEIVASELRRTDENGSIYEENLEEFISMGLHSETDEYDITHDLTWTLDHDGLTFFFNPYEIAPYAAGLMTAHLDVKTYGNLYKDVEGLVADDYVLNLSFYDKGYPFISTDWERNNTYCLCAPDGDIIYDLSDCSDASDLLLVHTGGKDYYYLRCVNAAGNVSEIRVLTWNSDEVKLVGTFNGDFMEQKTQDATMSHMMTDIEDFILKSSDGIIGHYHVGANGMPERN